MSRNYADVLRDHALRIGNGWADTVSNGVRTYLVTRVEPDLPRTTRLHLAWRDHIRSAGVRG